jgi:hypothetical protein
VLSLVMAYRLLREFRQAVTRLDTPPLSPRHHPNSRIAPVRHRTVRTRGVLSQDTARLMVFKLIMAAAKTWRRLKGENQLPKVLAGVTFRNGVEVTDTPEQSGA